MEIYCTKEQWETLNKEYSREIIIDHLVSEIMDGNIKYPLKRIFYNDCMGSFIKLKEYKCNPFFTGNIYTKDVYKYPLSGKYIDESGSFYNVSDFYHQEERCKYSLNGLPSPVHIWHDEKLIRTVLPSLWTMNIEEITDQAFHNIISMNMTPQFNPAVAKSIYEKYNSKDVLDFSVGWGDRLAGFCACENTRSYVGIEPNINLHKIYPAQAMDYDTEKITFFINGCAEDVESPILESFSFDTIFTSPLYFDIDGCPDNQPWKKYQNINEWLNGCLLKSIERYWKHLKTNGHLIINISDIHFPNTIHKICDTMNDFINTLPRSEFVECIGMKTDNNSESNDRIFVEPIWVWKKTL